MQKIIVIVGPTAVGKTQLSIELAHQFHGEIINGDSLQVYRGLDIGSAKASMEEMQGIAHHLIDICDLRQEFSASDFKVLARKAVDDICSRGKLPIVVGGTGLYIEGFLNDFHYSGPSSQNEAYRQVLQERLNNEGSQVLWEELKVLDPQAADTIHPNNGRRIIRALEVIQASGQAFSKNNYRQSSPIYDAFLIGLEADRTLIYERINKRVEVMVAQGLVEEAKGLYDLQLDPYLQSLRGIGYKEWFPYFDGQASLEETIALIQQSSRRYAKRQFTWFRNRLKDIHWYNLLEEDASHQRQKINEDLSKFLKGSE